MTLANSKLSARTEELLTELVNFYYEGDGAADQIFCDVCADEGLDVYETSGVWATLVSRRPVEYDHVADANYQMDAAWLAEVDG